MAKDKIMNSSLNLDEKDRISVAELSIFAGFNSRNTQEGNIHLYKLLNEEASKVQSVFIPKNKSLSEIAIYSNLCNVCKSCGIDIRKIGGFSKSNKEEIYNVVRTEIIDSLQKSFSDSELEEYKVGVESLLKNYINSDYALSNNAQKVLKEQIEQDCNQIQSLIKQ